MFRTFIVVSAMVAASAVAHQAQQPSPSAALKSTEVLPDHSVVFRLYAPKASAVALAGDFVTQGRATAGAMKKDDQGIWSITVGPLVPDFYSYFFTVDRPISSRTWSKRIG